jgi:hypothetical protein
MISMTTFNEDFEKVAEEKYNMCGYDLDNFESLLLAYSVVMEEREPQATRIHEAIQMVHDSIEN